MKNETVGAKKLEGKAGLSAATLPWWAKALIAQHSESSFPASTSHHLHHCSYCGCALISTSATYPYAFDLCPDCHERLKTTGTARGPRKVTNGNRESSERSDKIQPLQGGN